MIDNVRDYRAKMGTALLSGEVLLAELVEAADSSGVQSLARVLMLSEDAHPVGSDLNGALEALPAERVVRVTNSDNRCDFLCDF